MSVDPAAEARATFCRQLRELHKEAGSPSYPDLIKKMRSLHPPASGSVPATSTISELLEGKFKRTPPWDRVEMFVRGCVAHAGGTLPAHHADLTQWRKRHTRLEAILEATRSRPAPTPASPPPQRPQPPNLGLPIAQLDNLFAMGVPPPVYGLVLDRGVQGNYVVPRSTPAPQALAPLPPAPGWLVGREDQARELLNVLSPREDETPADEQPVVVSVAGMPGVGKTALALHVAHQAQARGWFPGGILFINLRGYDPDPIGRVTDDQALSLLLRQLGVWDADQPPTTEEKASHYRSRLADLAADGKAVLLVVDNATSAAQIKPLLPGQRDHRVLVTSRHTLASLPARLLDLAVLDPSAAADLISRTLTDARPDDQRCGQEPDALRRLATRCGFLPLALQIAAAILNADSQRSVDHLAAELEDERNRLAALCYDDDGYSLTIRAVFDLSYRRLDDDQARLFRQLALNPGPDLASEAAAALVGKEAAQVRPVLVALAQAHLLEPVEADRWQMHDLIHAYAVELADQAAERDQREEALDRLLEHYRSATDAASDHMMALPAGSPPGRFSDITDAHAWLDREQRNLVLATVLAVESGRPDTAFALAVYLSDFLFMRGHRDDILTVSQIALAAAQTTGDQRREGVALVYLAQALTEAYQPDQAVATAEQAVAIFRQTGDSFLEGHALQRLCGALILTRRFEQASTAAEQAVAVFRDSDDYYSKALTLYYVSRVALMQRRFEEAASTVQQAMEIFREFGDRYNEAGALLIASGVAAFLDRSEEAASASKQAIIIFREFGDRRQEAAALIVHCFWLVDTERFREVLPAGKQAIAILRETGDRHREGWVLLTIAAALSRSRRYGDALRTGEQAAEIFQEAGDRKGEAWVLNSRYRALFMVGRFEEAVTAIKEAIEIFRETGDRYNEADALKALRNVEVVSAFWAVRIWGRWRRATSTRKLSRTRSEWPV